MTTDTRHWHTTGDEPSEFAFPPSCCGTAFGKVVDKLDAEHYRRLNDAVRDERVRIVTESLAAITAYSDAAQSVLDDPVKRLMVDRATEKCAEAIRKVGCICPVINISSFGGEQRTMPGYDPRCGMHDHDPAQG